jgi:hypothetical protein
MFMPKQGSKKAKPQGRSQQTEGGEIILASRKTIVSNGIVSIEIPYIPIPHMASWDNEELAEIYSSGAR